MSIEGQGYFLTLARGHLHLKIETSFFSDTTGPFLAKFCMSAIRYVKMKIYKHDAGHMTKMAAMPIFGKKTSKIFFTGTSGPISITLCMKHLGLLLIKVCTVDDPGVTLTYFTVRSNFTT